MDDQSSLIPETSAEPALADSFATLVSADGRIVRMDPTPSGGICLAIGGRQPVQFDRFQVAALKAAIVALPES